LTTASQHGGEQQCPGANPHRLHAQPYWLPHSIDITNLFDREPETVSWQQLRRVSKAQISEHFAK
jgi:hypothetical protein